MKKLAKLILDSNPKGDSWKFGRKRGSRVQCSEPSCREAPPFLQSTPKTDPLARFEVEEGNRLAYRAVLAVSAHSSPQFNPLLLYGPSNCGKSHLLAGIAYRAHQEGRRIVRSSSRAFFAGCSRCRSDGTLDRFRRAYQDAAVWILDGYEALNGKPATAREVQLLFDFLKERGSQIVFAGRVHPSRLSDLPHCLRTRMLSGLDLPVQPLSPAGMSRVLARRWPDRRIASGEPFLPLIRKLGGNLKAAIKLLPELYEEFRNRKLTSASLRRALGAKLGNEWKPLDLALVRRTVGEAFDCTGEEMAGPSRKAAVSRARRVFYYLSREYHLGSQREVGDFLGRSAASVSNSLRKLSREMAGDSSLETRVRALFESLQSHQRSTPDEEG